MTKRRIWLMLLTALVISVVIVAGSMANAVVHPEPAAEEPVPTTQTHVSYVLRAWDGHIGLFRGDSETPYQELDMPLTLLSDYDREMVQSGIEVETERELRTLVEDLTS
ncbi:MAG: hypothetical protein ACI4JQ_04750 [Ruminococcus sp.]